jgi:FkbM family methyltransferase
MASMNESGIQPVALQPPPPFPFPTARGQSGHLPLAEFVERKLKGARRLGQLIRQTTNWTEIWKYRRQKPLLPPLRLRDGAVLYHGEQDNPLLMLDEVYVKRWYEIMAVPPPDANMIDIGANIGAVTLFWAVNSPSLRIHAYEPNPSAYGSLQRNIEENSLRARVRTFPEAVGRGLGEFELWVDVPTELSTGYLESSPAEGGRKIAVPMVGLDEIWSRLDKKRIWLLKIDTEGAEVDILEGASNAVLDATQNAIVEYHDQIVPGASQRCRRVLEAAGFECRILVHPWEEGIIYASRH